MKNYAIAGLVAFAVTVFAGFCAIPVLKKIKAGQPILKYVKTHDDKNGTPTMGGLFFILPLAGVFFAFGGGSSKIATVSAAIGLFYMLIGFLDDFIKVRYKHNEGLKPYQKIIFQTAIAVLAGVFAYVNGLSPCYLPFTGRTLETGIWIIPIVIFLFIAMTNSVNLTDGLDGLAGGVSLCYSLGIFAIIMAEKNFPYHLLKNTEYDGISLLIAALTGGTAGFLTFNISKAKVFMGDTGSLALGGLLCSVSVFSGNAFFVPVIGAAFVWSSLSVIIQVAHFKRTKTRVFLMAPFHHHLQMKGLTEPQISWYYSVITVILGVLSVIFYI